VDLGDKPLRIVDEIAGGNAGAPIDVVLRGLSIDQHVQRLSHGRVAQHRKLGLDTGPFAVDLGPGIGAIELDVLDVATGRDYRHALAALFQPLQDLILDLHVPSVVVLPGPDDGPGGGNGVTARKPGGTLCSPSCWR